MLTSLQKDGHSTAGSIWEHKLEEDDNDNKGEEEEN